MSGITSYLVNALSSVVFGPSQNNMDPATSFYEADRYVPSIEDVIATKDTLFERFKLPIELIDTIIDFAEYFPRTTMCRTGGELHVRSGGSGLGGHSENRFLLRSFPLGYVPKKNLPNTCSMNTRSQAYPTIPATPWQDSSGLPRDITEDMMERWALESRIRGEHPCRKIVFTLVSHDQGWGGEGNQKGTYKGSYTWFDVGKERIHLSQDKSTITSEKPETFPTMLPEHGSSSWTKDNQPLACTVETIQPSAHSSIPNRFEFPLNPTWDHLQKNRTATKEAEEYQIVWSCDDNVDPNSLEGKALENQGRGRNTANGQFVRDLKVGDIVTVWGKARFPGWVNMIETVRIDVYWRV
ncbi:hypothetical protein ONS95_004338 [Cadophora gregata]|uniref:uncharacterized protein n=1 Tax=Cadophora gregata TaxID=51156 RepID=UPI0026DBE346|nr:uncharacterized protein ONS95_004338 [Cadophora gregata]KAK0105277.1 hypothetical protein ONS96_004673 [Cadophora gregata f. sp. sojae]KAK0105821.1 hypothetical protein ONS95_004338 [Cadophora gregata]